jgi:hypothetical protein
LLLFSNSSQIFKNTALTESEEVPGMLRVASGMSENCGGAPRQ